ncbi:arginase [Segnochrobactrum spirostomi]|uniref:Arginase n=1 Tax=Segnochrobactrum spirostomi TaxID=2608987 RepID=A0A6A7Y3B7_9HYPH|nr:arginase [Segnochrobactrum spirostomi]MQT12591.1 arginase [Segnochrobactrum spirostomi]
MIESVSPAASSAEVIAARATAREAAPWRGGRARAPVRLIGAPVELGASLSGCQMGPAALRTAGLVAALAALGHTVEDLGDLAPRRVALDSAALPAGARNVVEIAGWARSLSDQAFARLQAGDMPIFVGGDHSLSMGTVNGAARHAAAQGRELFVLWLDAHADYNTPATSPSGNLHGMPAALICGEPGLDAIFGDEPRMRVPPRNLSILGVRSIDPGERELLAARGVDVIDMRLVDERGVGPLIESVLARVAACDGLLHVSFDVDVLDPALAPGVGTAVPGGLTYREAHLAMEMLHDSGLVCSVDVVELNPFLDERGRSALTTVELVASLFGRRVFDRRSGR